MKLDRGMKVEVLTKKKVPSGAWRCAQIMADNGDSCTVRYYCRLDVLSEVVEKVPVEAVRPCPPRAKGPLIWLVGDTVEVLDGGYWKTAEIEEVMGENYYYIHLIGSIDEFRVEKSSIRERQEWRDNKWVLIEKDSGICMDIISKMLRKDRAQPVPEVTGSVVSKSLKRSAPYSAPGEALSERAQKRRPMQRGELETIPGDSYSFIGKVDAIACPTVNQVKNKVQTLIKKKKVSSIAIHKNQNDAKCCARTSESDDCLSTTSSSASCSFVDASCDRLRSPFSAGCSQDIDSLCSDAESFVCFGDVEEMAACQSKGECALGVHENELYTYRYILESLYASGPLSWEQEIILTNIRIRLDVSNDEHLMELRRLMSIGNLRMSCC